MARICLASAAQSAFCAELSCPAWIRTTALTWSGRHSTLLQALADKNLREQAANDVSIHSHEKGLLHVLRFSARGRKMIDLLIRGASIVDGSGRPAYTGDVAIEDDRIVAVGAAVAAARAKRVVHGEGLVVSPGFIDLHTHVDFTLPAYPRASAMVRQGVTTVVAGNCGSSPFPVSSDHLSELREATAFHGDVLAWDWGTPGEYLASLDAAAPACNVALLVGHGATRIAVMGFDKRSPTTRELERMRSHVAEAFEAGVFGLSTGLSYAPACFSATDEVVELAKVAHRFGGLYATHVRNEADGLVDAVREAIEIGSRAKVRVELSHHKALERRNWGKVTDTLGLIDEARARDEEVCADQYPYDASSTTLMTTVPRWAFAGGIEAFRTRVREPSIRAQIRSEIIGSLPSASRGSYEFVPDNIFLAHVPLGPNHELQGLLLQDAASRRHTAPVDLLLHLLEGDGAMIETVTFGRISDEDLRRVMRHPMVSIASDGWTLEPAAGGRPHPRSYGTFVRVLGPFVRDLGVLTLEEAVRKMTSLPAGQLRIPDRGHLAAGAKADVVLFDPTTVGDAATYLEPHQFAVGVHLVVVNGRPVFENGEDTMAQAGVVLRRGLQRSN